jgi:hypothetical protein
MIAGKTVEFHFHFHSKEVDSLVNRLAPAIHQRVQSAPYSHHICFWCDTHPPFPYILHRAPEVRVQSTSQHGESSGKRRASHSMERRWCRIGLEASRASSLKLAILHSQQPQPPGINWPFTRTPNSIPSCVGCSNILLLADCLRCTGLFKSMRVLIKSY